VHFFSTLTIFTNEEIRVNVTLYFLAQDIRVALRISPADFFELLTCLVHSFILKIEWKRRQKHN